MPQRSVASNYTFEQQRNEINLLAADFWTQKTNVDNASSTYLKHNGSNDFTGGTLNVPNAFTISPDSGNGTLTISGNLNVTGTTTTVNTTNLDVTDKNITIAKGNNADSSADGAGLTIDSATDITWNFVDAKDAWVSSIGVEATTFLKAPYGQFTAATNPTTGQGVEVNAPDANTGQVSSYDRDNSAYKDLRIKGAGIDFYAGSTNAIVGGFHNTGLVMQSGKTIELDDTIVHSGDSDTKIRFPSADTVQFETAGSNRLSIDSNALFVQAGFPLAFLATGGGATPHIKSGGSNNQDLLFTTGAGNPNRLYITAAGKILGGNQLNDRGAVLQIESSDHSQIGIHRNTADHGAPAMNFSASRGTSAGAVDLVQDEDYLGLIRFSGADGSDLASGAQITAIVDGTAASNVMPTRLGFWTSLTNDSPVERLRIHADGKFTVGTSPNSTGYGQWAFLNYGTGGADATGADKGMCIRSDTGPTNNSVLSNLTSTLKLVNNAYTGAGVSGSTGTVVKLLFNGATSNGWNAYGAIGLDVQGTSGGKGDLFFNTGGEATGYERLRITNTGQVKIGNNPTIDANTNLHVQEENGECGVVIDGNTGGAGAYLLLKNRSTSSNPRTYISGIDAGGQGIAQIDFWNLDNDNNEGAISLSTRPSGGSMTQRLYIDSSGNATFTGTGGNVHTFTSDSYHVLDIVADSNNDEGNSDNIIRFRHGSGGSLSERAEIRYDESDAWLELSAGDNQNHLVIKSDGFVGVGVNPTAKLHVSAAYNQVGLKVAGGAHNGYSSPLQVVASNGDMRLEVSADNGVQFTRGPVGGAEHVSNTPDMWQKIGIWKGAFVDGAARCKITVMGTDTHDSNGNVAGETIIYLAFGANHVLKGYFYSTTGQFPGIAGVAWNYDDNDSSNKKVEVWVKYDSAYGMTSCYADCSTGLFEGSNINSGLTTVPAGATEIESYFTIRTATGGSSHERLRINPDGTVKVAQDLLMDKASDPKIYSGANVGLNIDGGSLYLNRNVQSSIELAWGGGPVNMTNTADADVQLNIYKQSGADTNQAILRIGYDSNNNYSISRVRNSGQITCDANQGGAYVYHRTESKDVAILTPTQVFATAKHASKVTAYSGINTAHWGEEAVKKFYASYYTGANSATYHVARVISQTDWGFDNIEIKVAKYQYQPNSNDLHTKQFTTYYGSHQSRISNYNQQSSGSGTGNWNVLNWRQDFGPGGAHYIHNQNNGGYYRDCYGSDLYVECGVYTGMRLEFTVWASAGTYDCGNYATAQDFYPAAFGGQASQTDADNWNGPRGTWFNSAPNGTGQGTNYGLMNFSTGSVYGESQI